MRISARSIALGALAAALALPCACSKPAVRKPAGGSPASGRLPEAVIRGGGFASVSGLKAARFPLDGYALSEQARETLKRNAATIAAHQDWQVLVEGHCDERGTTEYNLSLGQRRAKAVRDYYLLLGVPGDRVATISYGEERPPCSRATEECWATSRRAESKVRTAASARGTDPAR